MFVTHDQEEALEVADLVAVMNEGRIEQVGTPDEVYHRPVTPFVYNFLGNVNLFHGRIEDEETLRFTTPLREVDLRSAAPAGDSSSSQRRPLPGDDQAHQLGGPLVKVEAVTDWAATVRVELSQAQFLPRSTSRKMKPSSSRRKEVAVFDNGAISGG